MSLDAGDPSIGARPNVRRRKSAGERRREVVAAAAELFDRAGYATVTMEDIAREVGVAKTTLYHYFRNKDAILQSIHEEFIDLLLERHKSRLTAGLSPEMLLLEVMADVLELMETHRGHVRVFFEHHRELPDQARMDIALKRDEYEMLVRDVVRAGIESGAFRECSPPLVTLAIFGMCNWAYQWYRVGGPLRTRDIAYQFYGYLVQGITSFPQRPGHVHDAPLAGPRHPCS